MPKLKTHTGAKKRFSKTGTGKIKRHQTKTRHILSSKSPKVKRKLGKIRACFRWRLREGSAHDSLRLSAACGSPPNKGSAAKCRWAEFEGPRR